MFFFGKRTRHKKMLGTEVQCLWTTSAAVHKANNFHLTEKMHADLPELVQLEGQWFWEGLTKGIPTFWRKIPWEMAQHGIKALANLTGGGILIVNETSVLERGILLTQAWSWLISVPAHVCEQQKQDVLWMFMVPHLPGLSHFWAKSCLYS